MLLSGQPGVGKTTVLKRVIAALPGASGGFYSQEIRAQGRRLGFEIVTLEGERATLAHVDNPGPPRVGRYGVHVDNVDKVAVPAVYQAVAEAEYVIIDEIGRMELFSEAFRTAVLHAVSSPKWVLGTVMLRPHPWVDKLKQMPGTTVVVVTPANRDLLVQDILPMLAH
jgi:nucleoside-triphosphatase